MIRLQIAEDEPLARMAMLHSIDSVSYTHLDSAVFWRSIGVR